MSTHARGDRQGILQPTRIRCRCCSCTAAGIRRVVLGRPLPGLLRRCRLPRGRAEPARARRQPHREAVATRVSIADYIDDRPFRGRRPGRPPGPDRPFPGRLRRCSATSKNHDAPAAVLVGSVPPQGVLGLGDAHLAPPPVDDHASRCRPATCSNSSAPRRWPASTSSAPTRPRPSSNPAGNAPSRERARRHDRSDVPPASEPGG